MADESGCHSRPRQFLKGAILSRAFGPEMGAGSVERVSERSRCNVKPTRRTSTWRFLA